MKAFTIPLCRAGRWERGGVDSSMRILRGFKNDFKYVFVKVGKLPITNVLGISAGGGGVEQLLFAQVGSY